VFGWKPTHGVLPTDGVQPLSTTLDHLGVLARDPIDAWEVGQVLARAFPGCEASPGVPVPRKPRRLLQLRTQGWEEAGEPSRRAMQTALAELAAEGVEIVPFDDPHLRELDAIVVEAAQRAWSVFGWESQWPLRAYRDRGEDMIGPRLKELLGVAAAMTRADHVLLLRWRHELRERVAALAGPDSAFVSIASSGPAPKGLENTGSRACGAAWTFVGGPAFSLPVLGVDGLPLGLQLMSAPHADADAFAMARWILDRLPAPYTLNS
jgi:Asp-tRNA(Asn)/Glu-tRNA(Gln) amidotransferase A subunit family amidase